MEDTRGNSSSAVWHLVEQEENVLSHDPAVPHRHRRIIDPLKVAEWVDWFIEARVNGLKGFTRLEADRSVKEYPQHEQKCSS